MAPSLSSKTQGLADDDTVDVKRAPRKRLSDLRPVKFDLGDSEEDLLPSAPDLPPQLVELISKSLQRLFFFSSIGEKDRQEVVRRMMKEDVKTGDTVIEQGASGDKFYVVESGTYDVYINDKYIESKHAGDAFGDIALLYNVPRTATIKAKTAGILWSLNSMSFRRLVSKAAAKHRQDVLDFLAKVEVLKGLTDEQLSHLADTVQVQKIAPKTTILTAKELMHKVFMISSGTVALCAKPEEAQSSHEKLSAGEYFAERCLVASEPLGKFAVSLDQVTVLTLEKQAFAQTVGEMKSVLDKNLGLKAIDNVELFSKISVSEKQKIVRALHSKSFKAGSQIIKQGEEGDAFYIIKEGTVAVTARKDGAQEEVLLIERGRGEYFGELALLHNEPRVATVTAKTNVTCMWLSRESFESLLGPLRRILEREGDVRKARAERAKEKNLRLEDFEKVRALGAGAFGRVYLAKHKPSGTMMAMKAVNKRKAVKMDVVAAVVQEKSIMESLHSDFLLELQGTGQDKENVYFIVDLIPGGELFARMVSLEEPFDERVGRFYAANILEAMEYLHDRSIVYRDLKPENIMIGADGYLKMVDFGTAKTVPRGKRTYSLCGSPEYVAPEVLLGRGYNSSCDVWSFGVMVFETIVGFSPFNPSQTLSHMEVCQNIINGRVRFPRNFAKDKLKDFLKKVLNPNPAQRLGCMAGGLDDIRNHPWFSGLNWEALRSKRLPAPWVPPLKSQSDTQFFAPVAEVQEKVDGKDWGKGWAEGF